MKRLLFTLSCIVLLFPLYSQIKIKDSMKEMPKKATSEMLYYSSEKVIKPEKAIRELTASPKDENSNRALKALYRHPYGTLIPSLVMDPDPDEIWKLYFASFFGPAFTYPWTFINKSTDATSYQWIWDNELWSTDENADFYSVGTGGTVYPFMLPGGYMAPSLVASFGSASNTYKPKMGNSHPYESAILWVSGQNMYVSSADIYGNTTGVNSNGYSMYVFTSAEGVGLPGSQNTEGWYYGTHYVSSQNSRVSHLIQYHKKPVSPMLIKDVTYICVTESTIPIPHDVELKLTIYKLNEEGTLDFNGNEISSEVLMESSIYGYQVVPDELDWCYLRFSFLDIDPITGLQKQTNFIVNEAFAFVLSGLDEDGCDIGVAADDTNAFDDGACFIRRVKETGEMIISTSTNTPVEHKYTDNMYIMMNAHFPYLYTFPEDQELFVPSSGGYAVNINDEQGAYFYSEFDFIEDEEPYIFYEVPGWITVTEENSYFDEYGVLYLDLYAEALPANIDGRSAEIKVWAYGHSAETSFTINQGVVTEYDVVFKVYGEGEEPIDDATIIFNGVELDGYSTTSIEGTFSYSVSKENYVTYNGEVNVDGDVLVRVDLTAVGIYTKTTPILKLFPNPFTNEININNPAIVKNVQIMNLAGQSVKGVSFKGNSISTVELTNGVYFVIIETITGEKSVHKMVKK